MAESFVIIGDGVAGASGAETIRAEAPDASITIITDEGEPLYNRILIKEFAKGKIPEDPLAIHDPDWYAERDIDLRLNTLVTRVDTTDQIVYTHDDDQLNYDNLLLASGGTPSQLPVPNSDATGVHHFWTFEDARRIAEHAEASATGVVVGAGLLGIDFAAICGARGINAHYLMRGESWWRYALTDDGADIVHTALQERGVTPVFGVGVDRFEVDTHNRVRAAVDSEGQEYDADFVGIAIGLDYNTEYLQGSGIKVAGGIVVDEHMRTTAEGVYAAGDITRYYDVILDQQNQNGSWGSAKQQGMTAGHNMVHGHGSDTFRWVPSYSITHFDFPFLSFGHPTLGDDEAERRYSDTEWRRLTFKDGKLIGGVLIGNLSPQSVYKQLIRQEHRVADRKDALLERSVELDRIVAVHEQ